MNLEFCWQKFESSLLWISFVQYVPECVSPHAVLTVLWFFGVYCKSRPSKLASYYSTRLANQSRQKRIGVVPNLVK